MAVGRELATLTGFKLFHNHMSIDPILGIFDWGSPSFGRLVPELRRRVIEEAVISDLAGLIFTLVWNLSDPGDKAYVDRLIEPVLSAGQPVSFVELVADQETRLAREGTQLRLEHKRTKRDVEQARALLRSADQECQLNTVEGEFFYPDRYLLVDNSRLTAGAAAERIVESMQLPTIGS